MRLMKNKTFKEFKIEISERTCITSWNNDLDKKECFNIYIKDGYIERGTQMD